MSIFQTFRHKSPQKEPTEQELLCLLLQGGVGEKRAITILYGELRGTVLAWICQRGGDREAGCEIFQMAMLVLLDYLRKGKFDKLDRPRAFVFQVCKNQWYVECRRKDKNPPMPENLDRADSAQEAHISAMFNDERNRVEIQREFGRLKGNCQKHLHLYYYQNWTNSDIAQEFDTTENSVKSSRSQCIRKLKALIQQRPHILDLFKPFAFPFIRK